MHWTYQEILGATGHYFSFTKITRPWNKLVFRNPVLMTEAAREERTWLEAMYTWFSYPKYFIHRLQCNVCVSEWRLGSSGMAHSKIWRTTKCVEKEQNILSIHNPTDDSFLPLGFNIWLVICLSAQQQNITDWTQTRTEMSDLCPEATKTLQNIDTAASSKAYYQGRLQATT